MESLSDWIGMAGIAAFAVTAVLVVAPIGCVALIFALRAAAIRWDLTVPDWLMTKLKGD